MHLPALTGLSLLFVTSLAAQQNFPAPTPPAGNPITPDKALLGMALFFEEQLSSTGSVACATCHSFASGGGDPRTATAIHPGADHVFGTADDVHGSPGVTRTDAAGLVPSGDFGYGVQTTPRRAPTVLNSGYHTHLFYDGRVTNGNLVDPLTNQVALTGNTALENLVLQPPLNPVEMGHVGRTWYDVTSQLAVVQPLRWASDLPPRLQTFVQGRDYPAMFQAVFGTPQITPVRLAMAIATYLRTLATDQTKWDRHLAGAYNLTTLESAGLQLFNSPRNGATSCRTCHGDFEATVRTTGPIAGQMTMTASGPYGSPLPTRLLFHNVGARPFAEDPGRQGVTNQIGDAGKFRVASLRNVELTGPYFHNGSKATLRDVLDFYDRGGDFHANQAANFTVRGYTEVEKDALEAVLRLLTDPRVAQGVAPFDRPVLGSQTGRFVAHLGDGLRTADGTPVVADAPFPATVGESRFVVTLSGVSPGVFTMLFWDTQSILPDPASFNLALALSPDFVCLPVGLAPAAGLHGGFRIPLPLPADPSYRGLVLFAQWAAIEPATVNGFVLSNGLLIEVQ